jgi:FkbM family methyltransferase
MKGIINFESIWRRSLKAMGLYYKWLFWKERKSPSDKMLKMRALYDQFVQAGDLCFDIGANMGSRVSSFLMLNAKVVAVEPQKICFTELEKVFSNYPVTLVNKGVGEKEEEKDFYMSSNHLMSSFSKEWIEGTKKMFTKDNWDKVEKMQITTLDKMIVEYGKPQFIKIDTEGFEVEVLKGLSQPIKALSVEYTLPDPHQKNIACVEKLESLYQGKAVYNLCRDEAYSMHFHTWQTVDAIKGIITSAQFNRANFGNYGDIYVKMIS